MHSINSLLVVIEPHLMESLALKRAKHIACHTKAHLHLLICDKKHDHSALLSVLESSLKSEATVSAASRPGTKASTQPSSRCSRRTIAAWSSNSMCPTTR